MMRYVLPSLAALAVCTFGIGFTQALTTRRNGFLACSEGRRS
jgi:hypothetical protein